MSTADRPEPNAPAASDVAGRLRDADFVRLVANATGDGAAAAVLLARTLTELGVPYQLSVTALPEPAARETDADLTVALGRPVVGADVAFGTVGNHATRAASSVAKECGVSDIVLTLAGIIAGGGSPDETLLTAASERGIERRPGLAIPPVDPADGLAHSLLVHCEFSGDLEAARAAIDELDLSESIDEDGHRAIASMAALTVAGDSGTSIRGSTRIERFLRPLAGGPFDTVGSYADVLDAVTREQPGLGVTLALGRVDREEALSTWRAHASRAHETVRTANTGRYDGLFVAQCSGQPPVGTVARLLADYRSPEPLTLVVADGVAAARTREDDTEIEPVHVGETLRTVANRVDGRGAGTKTDGRATFDVDPTEFVVAFREEL